MYHRYEGFTTKYPFFPNGDVRDFHIKTRKLIFKIHYDVAPLSTGSVPMSDWLTDWQTNSMAQNPSWEANSSSTSQEVSRILWNSKAHYRVHKSPPFGPHTCKCSPQPPILFPFNNFTCEVTNCSNQFTTVSLWLFMHVRVKHLKISAVKNKYYIKKHCSDPISLRSVIILPIHQYSYPPRALPLFQ